MHTGKPLSGEATIPADDFVCSKSSHIPGQPKPIPPRNEPLLYIPIHNNLHTSFDECEIGSHLASAVAQAVQGRSGRSGLRSGDTTWNSSQTRDAERGKQYTTQF
jgi:hypothetical protein